jgi:hypothetical protein
MAKKRAAKKKAAKRTPARKKAAKRSARRVARVAVRQRTTAGDTIDLSTVNEGGVQAADSLAAVPVTPPASEAVNHEVAEVAAALPEVEAQVQRQQGPLAELVAYREVLWLVGTARRPRTAIFGRAVGEAGGVSAARPTTNEQAVRVISRHGPHHLRDEFQVPLSDYQNNAARHARTLSNLLGPAIAYLHVLDLVGLGTLRGIYLAGRGPEVFEGWPQWERPDEEPPVPRRSGRSEQGQPAAVLAPLPPGEPRLPRRRIMPLNP